MFNVLLCIGMKHDWRLVAAAALVCVIGSAASIFLLARTPLFPPWRRRGWLAMTGLVAGSTTFTTHFVAMLAFKTGLPMAYAPLETSASLLIAVVGATLALALRDAGEAHSDRRRPLLAGALLGAVIAAMHYLGMAGLRTEGHILWNPAYVAGSIVFGAVCAAGAFVLARRGASVPRLAAATVALVLAIAGLHFTGMTAATIFPDQRVIVPARLISDPMMATIAIATTALIVILAVAGATLDAVGRHGNLRRLHEALDAVPDGVAFFDPMDRLVAWNATYAELCRSRGTVPFVGVGYEALLRRGLEVGAYPDAEGHEVDWLAVRTALRNGGDSLAQRTTDGRWLRVSERRTSDGGTVTSCIDITDLKRAEAALTGERDRAEELARRAEAAESVAGLGHWRLDVSTKTMDWSPELYRIFGLAPGAALDLDAVLAMTHPDDAGATSERFQRQLRDGAVDERSVTRIFNTSGELRYLMGNSRGEFGPDGKVTAVIGTIADVTEPKLAHMALTRSEERFRRLATNAPAIIAESGLDGTMTYMSPASLPITGYAPEELVGRRFDFWMAPDDAAAIRSMCVAVLGSKGKIAPWSVEFRAQRKTGEPLWLECSPKPTHDPESGAITGFSDVIRDVTLRKQLEVQTETARLEAEDSARVKGEFLANMSHELRTPLTSIIGFTGLTVDLPNLPPLARTYVERVREASQALLCTVNDILDFSKLEAGQVAIHPGPVNLAALCESTLSLFGPQAGAKDIELVFDGAGIAGRVLLLDADRIRQVLLNFIGNAVKFTPAGSVTLRARYDDATEELSIDVIDTGPGIAPDDQTALFKRFSQVDGSTARSAGGTGLGLAICKGLIEAMGGRLGLESHDGEGSRFWFDLRAAASAVLAGDDNAAGPGGMTAAEGLRVLVVDDHPANRELARLYLAGVGAEVSEAVDGPEALQIAAEAPFDVILLDLRMPGLSGVEVLARLRATPGPNDQTPILAYTADAGEDASGALIALGFDDVVAKPVSPGVLIRAVARATAFEASAPAASQSHAA